MPGGRHQTLELGSMVAVECGRHVPRVKVIPLARVLDHLAVVELHPTIYKLTGSQVVVPKRHTHGVVSVGHIL